MTEYVGMVETLAALVERGIDFHMLELASPKRVAIIASKALKVNWRVQAVWQDGHMTRMLLWYDAP